MMAETNPLIRLSAAQLAQENALRNAIEANDEAEIEAASERLLQIVSEVIAELERIKGLFSAYALMLPTNRRDDA